MSLTTPNIDQQQHLTVFCGPMFAGKTQSLISNYLNIAETSRIAIKPSIDIRFPCDHIVSHDGASIPAISLHDLQHVESIAGDPAITDVFIDEGQFFIDLADKSASLMSLGKNVWVAGLNATADQRPWQSMSEIMAMADDIMHLKASKCHACIFRQGSHTIMHPWILTNSEATSSIKIGSGETYRTVCRHCLSLSIKR